MKSNLKHMLYDPTNSITKDNNKWGFAHVCLNARSVEREMYWCNMVNDTNTYIIVITEI